MSKRGVLYAGDQPLALAQADAARAYGDLSPYRIRLDLEGDVWHVDYDWDPEHVEAALVAGPRKLAKQAADVRRAMIRNSEILIEGQIPDGILEPTH